MGPQNVMEAEDLRGLDDPDRIAVGRFDHPAGPVRDPDRILGRHAGDRAPGPLHCFIQADQRILIHKSPGRIMDKGVITGPVYGPQSVIYGMKPFRPARCHQADFFIEIISADQVPYIVLIAVRHGDNNIRNNTAARQGAERMQKNRHPLQLQILFADRCLHAGTASRCQQDRRGSFHICPPFGVFLPGTRSRADCPFYK